MKKLTFQSILFSSLMIILSLTAFATEKLEENVSRKWPKEIKNDAGSLTVYQPQLEALEKNNYNCPGRGNCKNIGRKRTDIRCRLAYSQTFN